MSERVSVLIPCFNAAPYLAEAVDSIRRQSYPDIEIVVADDGSSDDSVDVCKALDVTLVEQSHRGISTARNAAFDACSGDLIAFLDADDRWTDGKLAKQLATLASNPGLAMVSGLTQLFKGDDELLGEPMFLPSLGSLLLRRETYRRIGAFDPLLQLGEDTDWVIRALELGMQVEILPDVVQWYRRHDSNTTIDRGNVGTFLLRTMKLSLDRRRAGQDGRVNDLSMPAFPDNALTPNYLVQLFKAQSQ